MKEFAQDQIQFQWSKKLLCIAILIFTNISNYAQTIISGKITDTKGESLIGVNISIVGSYDGATSNLKGEYSFETISQDSATISATYTGFVSQEKKINIVGKNLNINFSLKERINDLKAVVITAGAFEASDEKKGTVLKALDVVTTAGSNGDTYGALKTLPGTQQVNDREGLFVRGGTGSETQTFIDGTWVRNAFTSSVPDLGARGRFNPFIFKGTVFSAGGYSALYGQALSSAVILETIDLPERSSANVNLSTVGVGASVQNLSKSKKSSWGLGYNYVNLGAYFKIIRQNINYKKAPEAHQIDLNYRKKMGKNGMLKFYGYANFFQLNIQRENITSKDANIQSLIYNDEYGIKNKNLYGNLSFKNYYAKDWKLQLGLSASYNQDDISTKVLTQQNELVTDSLFVQQNWVGIDYKNTLITGKVVIEKSLKNLNAIRFGAEHIYGHDDNLVFPGAFKDSFYYSKQNLTENFTAGFIESDIYITNEIAGKIGLRAEYSQVLQKVNLAPRLSAAYKINKGGQFSFAYGQFFQKPELPYLMQQTRLNFMKSTHYILNYQYQPKDRLLRIELYHKNYKSLVKLNSSNGINNNGNGYAQGIELFYRDKKTIKGIDFWISYSYIDTKRDFLNYLRLTQPDFIASHVGSFVFKKFWTKYMFGINGTYTLTSGRPYLNYNTSNPNDPNADANLFMKDKTINYNNFSISANYIKTIRKAFTVFVVSVNNPFGFKQIYGYNYAKFDVNHDGKLYQQAVTPTAKQFVFLGMFMSWGIDRTQEAIDNNL